MKSLYVVEHKPFNEYFDHPLLADVDGGFRFFLDMYSKLYLDWENDGPMLGTPDIDHQTISLMLRVHLTPSEPMATLFPLEGNILPIEDRDEFG